METVGGGFQMGLFCGGFRSHTITPGSIVIKRKEKKNTETNPLQNDIVSLWKCLFNEIFVVNFYGLMQIAESIYAP